MKKAALIVAIAALAACGADGEPAQPTGTAQVSVSSNGVHAGGTVGVRKGPWTFGLGF